MADTRTTREILDMIDAVLPAEGNPSPEPATPATPAPFSPGSPTGPR